MDKHLLRKTDSELIIKEYKSNHEVYLNVLATKNAKQERITQLNSDIVKLNSEIELLEKEHTELLEVRFDSEACMFDSLMLEHNKTVQALEEKLSERKAQIEEKKKQRQLENEDTLNIYMQEYQAMGKVRTKEELSAIEAHIYELAVEREKLNSAYEKEVNDIEDKENYLILETEKKLNELSERQNEIFAEYAEEVEKYSKQVAEIKARHLPAISEVEGRLNDLNEEKNEEIDDTQEAQFKEIQLLKTHITDLDRQFKETDKHYKKQIRTATLRNEPTSMLKTQHNAALRELQTSKTKILNEIDKINNSYDREFNRIQKKWDKEIGKEEQVLNSLVEKRNKELEEPQRILDSIIEERDNRIESIENEINSLVKKREVDEQKLKRARVNARKISDEKMAELRLRMTSFAMESEIGVAEGPSEVYTPFKKMAELLPDWMSALKKLIGEDKKIDEIIDANAANFEQLSFEEMRNKAESCDTVSTNVPGYLLNLTQKFILSISVCLALMIVFICTLPNIAVGIVVPAIIFVGIVVAVVVLKRKLIKSISEAIYLANNYQSITQISTQVQLKAENDAYEEFCKIADSLYKEISGPEKAKKSYEDKERDIQNDYINEIANVTAEFDREKSVLMGEYQHKKENVESELNKEKETHKHSLKTIKKELEDKQKELIKTNKELNEKNIELDDDVAFLSKFEDYYQQFKNDFINLTTSAKVTEGKLRDNIYIIPNDEKCADNTGHLPVVQVLHESRPILILYDTFNITKDGNYQEKLGKMLTNCLLDMMLAFKTVNSPEIIDQYVVDEVFGGHELKGDSIKKLLHIRNVGESINEFKAYLESFKKQRELYSSHGVSIVDVNKQKTERGERPDTYKIFYIALKGDRGNSLSEDVFSLMNQGYKYGFVPVFLCDASMWHDNCDKDGSVYNKIKMNATTIIKYDGMKYVEVDDE